MPREPDQLSDQNITIELDRHWAEELWAARPPADMWPTLSPAQIVLLNAIKVALDEEGHAP